MLSSNGASSNGRVGRLAGDAPLRELSSSLLCTLVEDARTSDAVLRLLEAAGYHTALVRALPRQMAHLNTVLASNATALSLPVADGNGECATGLEAAALLHSLGYGMRHLTLALSHMLRSLPSPAPPVTEVVDSLADAPLAVDSALPLLALLLPTDSDHHANVAVLAEADIALTPRFPLGSVLRTTRDAVASATATVTDAAGRAGAVIGSEWPMVVHVRGHGTVELVDVRGLHVALSTRAGDGSGLHDRSSTSTSAILLSAVATNCAQETLHGAMHALASLRQLLLLLPLASPADRRLGPRLDLLMEMLVALAPPPHPSPPSAIAPIAPTLASTSLLTLQSLGAFRRVRFSAQLDLVGLALDALSPLAVLPDLARPHVYLLVVALLSQLHAAQQLLSCSRDRGELISIVSRHADCLLPLLSLDAAEGSPATQVAALALLSALLALQPSAYRVGAWTVQLCGSGLLNTLTASVAEPSMPLASELFALLNSPQPPPCTHAALWVLESIAGLILSMIGPYGEQGAGGVVVQSGAISNLVASVSLDSIPAYLDGASVKTFGGGIDEMHAALHARLLLTTLRVVSSTAAVQQTSRGASTLLASFLLRSDERVASMVAAMRAPMLFSGINIPCVNDHNTPPNIWRECNLLSVLVADPEVKWIESRASTGLCMSAPSSSSSC